MIYQSQIFKMTIHRIGVLSVLLYSSVVAVRRDPPISSPLEAKSKGKALTQSLVQHEYTLEQIGGSPICGKDVPTLSNSKWAYTAKDGSIVTYTCDVGFKANSGNSKFDFLCEKGKPIKDDMIKDSCSLVKCPVPQAFRFADMNWSSGSREGDFGSLVDFTCHPGYTGDGKAHGPKVVKMHCAQSGEYEYVLSTITSCQPIHCSKPLTFHHTTMDTPVSSDTLVTFGTAIQYTCETGYVLLGEPSLSSFALTCGADGEYVPNDSLPECVEAVCPDLPKIENTDTVHVAGKVPINSRVIYRCNDGYIVSKIPETATFNIRCDFIDNKAQYVIPPAEERCHPADCDPLPLLHNAQALDNREVWKYTEIANFKCNPGFAKGGVKGDTSFTGACNSLGLWNLEDNPKCEKLVCGTRDEIPPEMLTYGVMTPFSKSPVEYEMKTTVKCQDGTVVTNSNAEESEFEIMCGPDGDFISNGVCANQCPPIPKARNAISNSFGKVIEYGQPPAVIMCKAGYFTKEGSPRQVVSCSREGTLDPVLDCYKAEGYIDGEGRRSSEWNYEERQGGPLAAGGRSSADGMRLSSVLVTVVALVAVTF